MTTYELVDSLKPNRKDEQPMNTGRLKDMLADVDDNLPVLVKTSDGLKGVSLAYEEVLWDENTQPGDELEAFCLELVTAVEELDTYQVEEIGGLWCVRKQEDLGLWNTQAWFSTEYHPNAKKAAEAECARLNAEYRKEQSNGNQ